MLVKELVWLLLLLCIEEYLMESEDLGIYDPTAFEEALSGQENLAILCPGPKDTGMKNFRLYSSAQISEFDGFDDEVIQKTTFSDKKLAVIAHGYTENGDATWMRDMANALVGLENMNAITVNWGDLSTGRYDCVVQKNMPMAVQRVVDLLTKIVDEKHQKTGDIHLIGFSLGSHVMGRTGRAMKDAKKEVGRITGLDPAGPLFERGKVSDRLDASHAVFVDAIHTDTRLIRLERVIGLPVHVTVFAIGTNMRMAKSDFYANDGYHQPGCKSITFDLLTDPTITREELVGIVVCNHIRSVLLFIESIKNKNGFRAKRCENNDIFAKESTKTGDEKCIEPANKMGYFTDKLEEGVFYVKTNGEPPYAIEPRRRKKKTKKTRRA